MSSFSLLQYSLHQWYICSTTELILTHYLTQNAHGFSGELTLRAVNFMGLDEVVTYACL